MRAPGGPLKGPVVPTGMQLHDKQCWSAFIMSTSSLLPDQPLLKKLQENSHPGHHMVSGTLALLRYSVIYMNEKQGSSPDRGRIPVEWGEFRPSVHLFVRLSVRPPIGLSHARGGPSQAQGGPSQALEGQIQALGGPSQAVGGQSQGLEASARTWEVYARA